MGPACRTIRELGLALITAGAVVLLFVVYQLYGTSLTEARNQTHLATQFKTTVAAAAPIRTTTSKKLLDVLPPTPPGGAIEHLVIPSIHVDKFVVEEPTKPTFGADPVTIPGPPTPARTATQPSPVIAPPMARRSSSSTGSGRATPSRSRTSTVGPGPTPSTAKK